jgi:hypothetical protein
MDSNQCHSNAPSDRQRSSLMVPASGRPTRSKSAIDRSSLSELAALPGNRFEALHALRQAALAEA